MSEVFGVTCSGASSLCEQVTFYSECNFSGNSIVILNQNDCLDWQPASICIPRGKRVRVFDVCHFGGQQAVFDESVACIGDITFSMLKQFGITLEGKKKGRKHMKHSKKHLESIKPKVEITNI